MLQVGSHEYNLWLAPDSSTGSHTQWFYFAVRNGRCGIRYKLNVVNLRKDRSLYSQGMQPVIHSAKEAATKVGDPAFHNICLGQGSCSQCRPGLVGLAHLWPAAGTQLVQGRRPSLLPGGSALRQQRALLPHTVLHPHAASQPGCSAHCALLPLHLHRPYQVGWGKLVVPLAGRSGFEAAARDSTGYTSRPAPSMVSFGSTAEASDLRSTAGSPTALREDILLRDVSCQLCV